MYSGYNGGYSVLNFKGYAFTSGTEATLTGVYCPLSCNKKMKIVHGLVVGGVSYPDMPAIFIEVEGAYTAKIAFAASTVTIVVAEDDGITVTIA